MDQKSPPWEGGGAAGAGWGILLLQRLAHFQGDEQGLLDAGAALRPPPFLRTASTTRVPKPLLSQAKIWSTFQILV